MAIEVRRVDRWYGIWDGYNCTFVDPSAWQFNEKRVKEYLKKNPFPKDCFYSEQDFLHDILGSQGAFIVPCKWRRTAEYITELISSVV